MPPQPETTDKSASLPAKIAGLERRILDRKLSLKRTAASFADTMRDRFTSPAALLAASSLGFLLGMLGRRTASRAHGRLTAGPGLRRLVGLVLKFVALFRGLNPALRLIPAQLPASKQAAE